MYYEYDYELGFYVCDMDLDEDEFLGVVRMPLAEAIDMVMRGELPDSKTQTAVLKVARLKDQGAL